MTGEQKWTGVSRQTRRSGRRWSAVEHLCVVDYRYGPSRTLEWVVPVCGAKPGRASFAETTRRCAKCAAVEAQPNKLSDGNP